MIHVQLRAAIMKFPTALIKLFKMHSTLHRLGALSDGGERDCGPPEAVDVLLSQLGGTEDQSNKLMI